MGTFLFGLIPFSLIYLCSLEIALEKTEQSSRSITRLFTLLLQPGKVPDISRSQKRGSESLQTCQERSVRAGKGRQTAVGFARPRTKGSEALTWGNSGT